MKEVVAFDTETALFGPGCMAPPLACVSLHAPEVGDAGLMDARDGAAWFAQAVNAFTLVGQNTCYDLAVLARAAPRNIMPDIFKALDEGRIGDTKLREQLLAIASGDFDRLKFSLKDIASRRLGLDMEKGAVRVTFGPLRNTPLEQWPAEHREYARKDASVTYHVWQSQEKDREGTSTEYWQQMRARWGDVLADEPAQVRASMALHLATCWGMRTDPEAVNKLRGELEAQKAEFDAKLRAQGILRLDGSKDMSALKKLVEEAYGLQGPPLTEKGGVKTDRQTLLDSGDAFLMDIAEGGKAGKYLSTYLPWLEAGTRGPINPSFETLKATGRTGSREPNIQNFPVKGGLRECFIPRPGFVFVDADYGTLELRTLAQSCIDLLGHSSMAEALIREAEQGGPDLHSLLAGKIYGVSGDEIFAAYNAGDKEAAEKRKLAKAPNFGFPGGMGVDKFVAWAKAAYKVILTPERARELKEAYLSQWPEIPEFFQLIGEIVGDNGEGAIRLPRSGRVHGGKWFTEMCNLMFQGPAADGAKAAFYETQKRCYTVRDSALFGSRGVAFIHDEILIETPEDRAEAAKAELEELMKSVMREKATPNIPVAVDAAIMQRWGS